MSLSTTEAERAIEVDKEIANRSLYGFTKRAFSILEPKRQFIGGWHLEAICEHLEACYAGEIQELLINIPPRHMKSILASVMFPAWVWTKAAEKRFLCSAYAKSLSIRDSVKTRRIIQSQWYQSRWGSHFRLTGDQNAKEKFENDKTGYRIATSVGGAGTGEGGDFVCVDDPHKVREAESAKVREGVLDWWDQEMSSRENDPKTGCKIITMQRVHEKDLSGHVLAKGGYVHLMLPAEFEPERKCFTEIGFEDPRTERGQLIWEKRVDKPALDKLKRSMGTRTAAGQLQQRPSPAEGDIIKREWFQFYRTIPEDLEFKALSVDLSFSEGSNNSFAVFQAWGRKGPNKYLLGQTRRQIGFNDQLIAFQNMITTWVPDAKWVEKKANGAALIDVAKKKIDGIIAVEPHGSKEARLEAVSPQIEAGNVWLPHEDIAPWINDYIDELVTFPNSEFDDQVDATTQALTKLSDGLITDWEPISLTGESKWLRA